MLLPTRLILLARRYFLFLYRQFNIICRVVFDEADRNKNGKLDNGEVRDTGGPPPSPAFACSMSAQPQISHLHDIAPHHMQPLRKVSPHRPPCVLFSRSHAHTILSCLPPSSSSSGTFSSQSSSTSTSLQKRLQRSESLQKRMALFPPLRTSNLCQCFAPY